MANATIFRDSAGKRLPSVSTIIAGQGTGPGLARRGLALQGKERGRSKAWNGARR